MSAIGVRALPAAEGAFGRRKPELERRDDGHHAEEMRRMLISPLDDSARPPLRHLHLAGSVSPSSRRTTLRMRNQLVGATAMQRIPAREIADPRSVTALLSSLDPARPTPWSEVGNLRASGNSRGNLTRARG
jgi:hypothetical protein